MQTWGNGYITSRILSFDTTWAWVVRFTPRPFYLQENATDIHWTGGWVGPRADLDAVANRKIL